MKNVPTVADRLEPLLTQALGEKVPVLVRCWDGSQFGDDSSPITVALRRRALRHLLWEPNQLGLARAYVGGDLDVEGDIFAGLQRVDHLARLAHVHHLLDRTAMLQAARTALRLGVVGPPPKPPAEEAALHGGRHLRQRDKKAISHHYDISNDFYELILGESMTYSCAYWDPAVVTETWNPERLAYAQTAKFDLIAGKLGLRPGMRVLDVGCGWGGFAIHVARTYDVEVVGVTLSQEQAAYARDRALATGTADRVEIRIQDYRDIPDGPYDAISSIGMAEHVGAANLPEYSADLFALARPQARLLNHAIGRPPGTVPADPGRSFIDRYVFPDGEILPMATTVDALETAGWEVRDVEALREHYALTLRAWVHNLEQSWAAAVADVGEGRARVWKMYMAGSALAFERNRLGVNQVLAVKPDDSGASAMPKTRAGLRP